MRCFNLCGRRGAKTSDQISRHAILITRRSTVQRSDLVLVARLVDARWRLLLLMLLLLVVLLLLVQADIVAIVLVNSRFAHFVVLGIGVVVVVDGGGACGRRCSARHRQRAAGTGGT